MVSTEHLKKLDKRNSEEKPATRDLNKGTLEYSHCLRKGK